MVLYKSKERLLQRTSGMPLPLKTTFIKMQQLNKVSTLEVVALRRFGSEAEKRHTMSEFAKCKLDVFLSGTICTA